jgi:hypothetical protein
MTALLVEMVKVIVYVYCWLASELLSLMELEKRQRLLAQKAWLP